MPERPKLVISNISFRDKLYYRLVVSNKIGDGKSGTVYINVTGSMILCRKYFCQSIVHIMKYIMFSFLFDVKRQFLLI